MYVERTSVWLDYVHVVSSPSPSFMEIKWAHSTGGPRAHGVASTAHQWPSAPHTQSQCFLVTTSEICPLKASDATTGSSCRTSPPDLRLTDS